MSRDTGTIVVLTALDLEYHAVRKLLTNLQATEPVSGTRFEVGTVPGHETRIVLMVAGPGNHSAGIFTERAITEFDPDAVLCVGVAGALHDDLSLGDVVVGTQVYAYHGGTSEDDQFNARPRAWQAPHHLEQLAKHIRNTKLWADFLRQNDSDTLPEVHFRAIAAGEVVIQSRVAEITKSIRLHYNDAAAVEMEGAGVALASHLNQKPAIVIRGISDMADATKNTLDRKGWQKAAAANAAAFAVTLAVECAKTIDRRSPRQHSHPTDPTPSHPSTGNGAPMTVDIKNTAEYGAQVGMQVGQLWNHGHLHFEHFTQPDVTSGVSEQLGSLRNGLRIALEAGHIDRDTLAEAVKEIDTAESALPHDTADRRKQVLFSMKRLRGIVGELAELGAVITAIIKFVSSVK